MASQDCASFDFTAASFAVASVGVTARLLELESKPALEDEAVEEVEEDLNAPEHRYYTKAGNESTDSLASLFSNSPRYYPTKLFCPPNTPTNDGLSNTVGMHCT